MSLVAGTMMLACRDMSRFSSHGGRFQGGVVKGSFVRSGISELAQMCITLDTEHLQDAPGTVTTSDGRFQNTALRPIPQLWHDPLSTLTFGDGRIQNLVYAASPGASDGGAAEAQDVLVVLSLMQGGQIEARLLRGAPQTDAGPPPPGAASAVFGVFTLDRQTGPCAF